MVFIRALGTGSPRLEVHLGARLIKMFHAPLSAAVYQHARPLGLHDGLWILDLRSMLLVPVKYNVAVYPPSVGLPHHLLLLMVMH